MTFKDLKKLKIGDIKENVDLTNYNTFKVHTTADFVVYPTDVDCLIKLLKYLKNNKARYKVLGNGSNVVFSDKPFKGVIIKLDNFKKLSLMMLK
jgi:UDP-N-acetylmuramate dehydrogenase